MTFKQQHDPKRFTDLVFNDPAVKQILLEYSKGSRVRHLILHGPKGSGKSCAGQMIMKERLPIIFPDMTTTPINGRTDPKRKDWTEIWSNWNWQRTKHNRAYTQIDEVDRYSNQLLDQLDEFLENDRIGTLIMTTNEIHTLDEWITDRCEVVEVLRPVGLDYASRAYDILIAEGYPVTKQMVDAMVAPFAGSWRSMIKELESFVLRNPPTSQQPHVRSQQGSAPVIKPTP